MSKYYTIEALNSYATYHIVRLIDFENEEFIGWFVPKSNNEYCLLPLNQFDNIYVLKRSHIKKLYHISNGMLIPKIFEDNFND